MLYFEIQTFLSLVWDTLSDYQRPSAVQKVLLDFWNVALQAIGSRNKINWSSRLQRKSSLDLTTCWRERGRERERGKKVENFSPWFGNVYNRTPSFFHRSVRDFFGTHNVFSNWAQQEKGERERERESTENVLCSYCMGEREKKSVTLWPLKISLQWPLVGCVLNIV
jgi:hypothetical protein